MASSYPRISDHISWESINIDTSNRQTIFPILCYNVTVHPIQSFLTFLLTRQKGKRRFALPELTITDEDDIMAMSYISRGTQYLRELIGLDGGNGSTGLVSEHGNTNVQQRSVVYAGIYEHHNGHYGNRGGEKGEDKVTQYLVYFVSNHQKEMTLPPCEHVSKGINCQQISAFFTAYELRHTYSSGEPNRPFIICPKAQRLFQENSDLGLYNATDTVYNLPIVVYHCNCLFNSNKSNGSTITITTDTYVNKNSVLARMLGTETLKDKVMSLDMWKTMGPFKERRYNLSNYYYFFQNVDVCPRCQDAAHFYTRYILLSSGQGSRILTVDAVEDIEDTMLQENDIITILLNQSAKVSGLQLSNVNDFDVNEPLFICTNCERYVRLD